MYQDKHAQRKNTHKKKQQIYPYKQVNTRTCLHTYAQKVLTHKERCASIYSALVRHFGGNGYFGSLEPFPRKGALHVGLQHNACVNGTQKRGICWAKIAASSNPACSDSCCLRQIHGLISVGRSSQSSWQPFCAETLHAHTHNLQTKSSCTTHILKASKKTFAVLTVGEIHAAVHIAHAHVLCP